MSEIVPLSKQIATMQDLMKEREAELIKVLPKTIRPDRMIRCAISAAQKTPKLLQCTKLSFYAAVLEASALGLEIGVGGQGYLVPFKNKVTFIPGYQGLAQLAYRSSRVSQIEAGVVFTADEFFYQDAPSLLKHTRSPLQGKDRGEFDVAYAGWQNNFGHWRWERMFAWELEAVKNRAAAGKSKDSPWNHPDDVNEMRKKTVFKRLVKYMPMSVEDHALQRAIELDNRAEAGLDQGLEASVALPDDSLFDQEQANGG